MLRKTSSVLAKAAALTGGLTVDAFAHGGGLFGGGHAKIFSVGLRVRILRGATAISVAREDSNATEVSITGVLAAVSTVVPRLGLRPL